MKRLLRLRRAFLLLLVLGLGGALARGLWVNGVFSRVEPGFFGVCKPGATLAGVTDIEVAGGTAFIAVSSARGISDEDGIYALKPGGKPVRLEGAPGDFHPRGISLMRSPDGTGLFLLAVNRRSTNRFSIETFEVKNPQTAPELVSQGTVAGGLLSDPQDVAATGPGTFYVSNNDRSREWAVGGFVEGIRQRLVSYGIIPGSSILYFNGMSFRTAADGFYGARGITLMPDGSHLLVASLTARSVQALSRESFSGNLEEAGNLSLPVAPEKMTLDGRGELWVGGHANLLQWRAYASDAAKPAPSQVFRITLSGGVPQAAEQAYGNDGKQIGGASVAAMLGNNLLIGSSLDNTLLDCIPR